MNILVACNEKYLRLAKYMLFSLYNYNGRLNVFLIHENVTDKSLDEFFSFFNKRNIGELNVIKFDSSTIKLPLRNDEITGHITKEAYFRLYAPFFLPDSVERILYLDCDIICTDDISELYTSDFEDNILIGVANSDLENNLYVQRLNLPGDHVYINSGVLLFNVNKYRNYISVDYLDKFICDNYDVLRFQDQDVINKLFYGKIKYENIFYNFQIKMMLYTEGGKLVHYTGPVKPWNDEFEFPILAEAYYDVLYKLEEYEELERIKRLHFQNFRNASKLISVIIRGDNVTEDLIFDVINQSDSRVEFIISYNTIDDGLIEKYSRIDVRLFFVKSDMLANYCHNLTGLYYGYFMLDDFRKMDVNFIRELGYFIDCNKMAIVFYNTFEEDAINKIISLPVEIDEFRAKSLIADNKLNNYAYIRVNNFSKHASNKYGYWEKYV